jgi:hypothetical protein
MKNIYYATPPLKTKIGGFGNVANTWYNLSKEDTESNFELDNNGQKIVTNRIIIGEIQFSRTCASSKYDNAPHNYRYKTLFVSDTAIAD